MKKQLLLIGVFYLLVMYFLSLMQPAGVWYIALLLTIVVTSYFSFEVIKRMKREPGGELLLRQQHIQFDLLKYLPAVLATVGWVLSGEKPYRAVILFVFWGGVVVFWVQAMAVRRIHPVMLAINGHIVTQNGFYPTNWDLRLLQSVSLNGNTGIMRFTYTNKTRMYLNKEEYKEADIVRLLQHCKTQSAQEVVLTKNLSELMMPQKS